MLNKVRLKLFDDLIAIASWFLWLSAAVIPKIYSNTEPEYFITDIIHGPIHVKDIPFDEVPVGLTWDKDTVMIDVRVLVDGKLHQEPVTAYCQWDKAQELLDHFHNSVEPIRVN